MPKRRADVPPQIAVAFGLPRRGLPAAASLRGWIEAALAAGGRDGAVALRLVDAEEGRALNRRYRGRDYATNVLSFPADPLPGGSRPLLGDIAICAPVVQREAAEQGKPARWHFAHLCVHGALHLLGHDHEKPRAAARMEALERRVLAALGVPDPYREAS